MGRTEEPRGNGHCRENFDVDRLILRRCVCPPTCSDDKTDVWAWGNREPSPLLPLAFFRVQTQTLIDRRRGPWSHVLDHVIFILFLLFNNPSSNIALAISYHWIVHHKMSSILFSVAQSRILTFIWFHKYGWRLFYRQFCPWNMFKAS